MAVSGCPMRKGRSKRTKLAYTNSSTMTGIALLLPLRRALPGPWHNYAPSWDSCGAQQVPALENGTAGTAVIVHIHLTVLGVLVDQIRHAVAVKVGGPHNLPAARVDATTEAAPTHESGPARAAVVVHIHLTRLRVLVHQIRRAVAVKVGCRLHLPTGGVDATTEAGPTDEAGSARAAIIVHVHLMGLGVLVDQIRRAIAVKIGHRDYLPVGGVDATTEAGPTYKRGPAVIVYIDLLRLGVLIDQIRRAVAVKIAGSHQLPIGGVDATTDTGRTLRDGSAQAVVIDGHCVGSGVLIYQVRLAAAAKFGHRAHRQAGHDGAAVEAVPALEAGPARAAIIVHIHLTRLRVLVNQIRYAIGIHIDGPNHLPIGSIDATTEAGPTHEGGPAGAAVVVHIHLMRLRVLVNQIRRAIAVKISHRDYPPVGGVDTTTETSPPDEVGPGVIIHIDLTGLGVLVYQIRRAVAVKVGSSH